MAASANPSGNNQEGSSATQKVSSSSAAATNGAAVNSVDNGGNAGAAADNSQTIGALRHNPGISTDWTHEEQSLLEDLLVKYSSCSLSLYVLDLNLLFYPLFFLSDKM